MEPRKKPDYEIEAMQRARELLAITPEEDAVLSSIRDRLLAQRQKLNADLKNRTKKDPQYRHCMHLLEMRLRADKFGQAIADFQGNETALMGFHVSTDDLE